MKGRFSLFLILLSPFLALQGQAEQELHPPLDIPLYLSGNFGEIRPDHFHSGIDIKTQGTTGHPVYSIDEGYVSRIKVQANGYGKSIYITHPSGQTSLYGHLNRYSDDIAAYVKEVQYGRKAHQVDIYLPVERFRIDKGQLIAYSGNTGSSFGPHLHFEIRNTANQHPQNVLKFDFPVKDHTPPRFRSIYIHPLEGESRINGNSVKVRKEVILDQGIYTVPWGTTLEASGSFALGVEVFDYLDGSHNRCGVYSLELFTDDKLVYSHKMDEFSFSESRYVNASTDYEEEILQGKKVHRLYRLPGDRLSIYGNLVDEGRLNLQKGEDLRVRILARDVSGNQSELRFSIKGGATGGDLPLEKSSTEAGFADHEKEFHRSFSGLEVRIPAKALYEDQVLHFSEEKDPEAYLEKAWQVHEAGTPLHRAYTLRVKLPPVDEKYHKQILLAGRDEKEGEWEAEGGSIKDGYLEAELRHFGKYYLCLDTLPPMIMLKNPMKNNDYRGRSRIAFTVTDDLSGIKSYEAYIDNRWALFEYDPKNELLVYYFDQDRISKHAEHELELYLKDERGNLSLYHKTFRW